MTRALPDAPATLAFEEALAMLAALVPGKMFGARVARAGDHLALVLDGEELVAYLGEAAAARAIDQGARPWSPMGPGKAAMTGYVVVPEEAYAEDPVGVMPWALAAQAAALARPPKASGPAQPKGPGRARAKAGKGAGAPGPQQGG